jgi:hypothetical protein
MITRGEGVCTYLITIVDRQTGDPSVTPNFSKRIEFYKFIYLNKYLFVAFLCCEVFLYFILPVEVVEIRI